MSGLPVTLVRELAHAAGFPLVGVARVEQVALAHRERLGEWLATGRHGSMAWMAQQVELRLDPRRLAAAPRTVLALGVPYGHGPEVEEPPPPGAGRVARYARAQDYHKVLGARCKQLRAALSRYWPDLRSYAACDTGPVLERYWAEQAGLGVRGQHGGIITPSAGSWVLLAELFCDRELTPDPPAVATCLACGACLRRCPTGALTAPGVLDSRRCLSFLTIEERGPLPLELRRALGDRVFGCDTCQAGCPHHAGRLAPPDPAFLPLEGRIDLDLQRILRLQSSAELLAWLAGSPVRRAGLEGLKRNAALVLGNQRHEPARGLLREVCAADPSPVVRGAAAWALSRFPDPATRAWLAGRLPVEPDSGVQLEIGQVLEQGA